jgi:hypothetical protein
MVIGPSYRILNLPGVQQTVTIVGPMASQKATAAIEEFLRKRWDQTTKDDFLYLAITKINEWQVPLAALPHPDAAFMKVTISFLPTRFNRSNLESFAKFLTNYNKRLKSIRQDGTIELADINESPYDASDQTMETIDRFLPAIWRVYCTNYLTRVVRIMMTLKERLRTSFNPLEQITDKLRQADLPISVLESIPFLLREPMDLLMDLGSLDALLDNIAAPEQIAEFHGMGRLDIPELADFPDVVWERFNQHLGKDPKKENGKCLDAIRRRHRIRMHREVWMEYWDAYQPKQCARNILTLMKVWFLLRCRWLNEMLLLEMERPIPAVFETLARLFSIADTIPFKQDELQVRSLDWERVRRVSAVLAKVRSELNRNSANFNWFFVDVSGKRMPTLKTEKMLTGDERDLPEEEDEEEGPPEEEEEEVGEDEAAPSGEDGAPPDGEGAAQAEEKVKPFPMAWFTSQFETASTSQEPDDRLPFDPIVLNVLKSRGLNPSAVSELIGRFTAHYAAPRNPKTA